MIRRLTSKFTLEAFEAETARAPKLRDYLAIYLKCIAPDHRTDTNELLLFLAEPTNDREVVYFGLSHDGVACGFATFMYYRKDAVGIIDHVAVDTSVRGLGAFFSFCDLIGEFLSARTLACNYVVVEVIKRNQSITGEIDPAHLIRLLRLIGFRAAQFPYVAPHEAILKRRESCDAVLMLASAQPRFELTPEECMRLVRTIYGDHYLKWYSRVWDSDKLEKYKRVVDPILAEISRDVGKRDLIKLNGIKNLAELSLFRPRAGELAANYWHLSIIIVPLVMTIALSLVQELVATAVIVGITLILLLLALLFPGVRGRLLTLFRQ